jgi:hypothetical protein
MINRATAAMDPEASARRSELELPLTTAAIAKQPMLVTVIVPVMACGSR